MRKMKRKSWILEVGLGILLGFCLASGYFLYTNRNTRQREYYTFTDQLSLNRVEFESYYDEKLMVREHDQYTIIDTNGNTLYELSPYQYYFLGGDVIAQETEKETKNIYYKNKILYQDVSYHLIDDYIYVYSDEVGKVLINTKGKVLLNQYDNYEEYENYILAFQGDKVSVYDKELHPIIEGKTIKKVDDSYLMNDKYIVLTDGKQDQVYYVKSKTYSEKNDNISINSDYVAFQEKNQIKVYNEEKKLVETINSNQKEYYLLTKDTIVFVNHDCDTEKDQNYVSIEGKDTDSKEKSCGKIIYNDTTITLKEDDNFQIYDANQFLFNIKKQSTGEVIEIDENQFKYDGKDQYIMLYDRTGRNLHPRCYNSYNYTSSLFRCASTPSIHYLYEEDQLLLPKSYASMVYSNGFVVVSNEDGYYGLYDVDNNQILEEKYEYMNLLEDNYLIYSYNNQMYLKKLVKASKKEYKKFLKENHNEEKPKNDQIDDVEKVIKDYKLEDQRDLINEHIDLFKRYAYHILENKDLSENDAAHFFKLFAGAVDVENTGYIDRLMERLDTLTVHIYKEKPESMEEYTIAKYYPVYNYIDALESDYESSIDHEIVHFFSSAYDRGINTIYECDNKILSYDETIQLPYDDQVECAYYEIDSSKFLEEGGAEFFNQVVYKDTVTETYDYTTYFYNLLLHVLDINEKSLEYQKFREGYFFQILNEKGKFSYEEAEELFDILEDVKRLDGEDIDRKEKAWYIYKSTSLILEMYNRMHPDKSWQEDSYIVALIRSLFRRTSVEDLELYLKENPEETIDRLEELKDPPKCLIREKLLQEYPDIDEYALEYMGNKIRMTTYKNDEVINTIDCLYDKDGKEIKIH